MPVSINNTQVVFNDATTQTTAPTISSATAVAGTGISVTAVTTTGAATHTVNNTGVTSIVAGTGISVNQATGAVTVTAAGGGVTSLNGQTGAIVDNTFDAIGSYAQVSNVSAGGFLAGQTTAGSNLYRANTIVSYLGSSIISNGNNNGTPPYTAWTTDGGSSSRRTAGNVGTGVPLDASALSGTWRCMASVGRAFSSFDAYNNITDATYAGGVWIRIS